MRRKNARQGTNRMNPKEKATVPLYARSLVYLIRPFPNFDFSFIKPVRRRAVELLALKAGDRVIDAGCGTGGSFPFLVEAVGAAGQVVGIEISPESCANTLRRIESNDWQNVELINASAQAAELSGKFDSLLMFAAPDVYASDEALDNIFPLSERRCPSRLLRRQGPRHPPRQNPRPRAAAYLLSHLDRRPAYRTRTLAHAGEASRQDRSKTILLRPDVPRLRHRERARIVGRLSCRSYTWNGEFLEEIAGFPAGPFDDQIDAVSLAVSMLRNFVRGGFSF